MNLASLVRNWWTMAVRGVLSILVGPNVTLSIVVMLFGLYALLDELAHSLDRGRR
jgi:uncharacterized membrane protein HdeD (DUF308 family)